MPVAPWPACWTGTGVSRTSSCSDRRGVGCRSPMRWRGSSKPRWTSSSSEKLGGAHHHPAAARQRRTDPPPPTQRCPRRTHPRIPSRGIRTNNHRPDRRQASPNARAQDDRPGPRTTPTDRASIPTINTPPLELAPFTVTMKWHPSGPRLRSLNSRSRSDTRPDRPNTSVDPATQL